MLDLLRWQLAGHHQSCTCCTLHASGAIDLTSSSVGLYPRDGIYCHLDHSGNRAVVWKYRRRRGFPWILATRHVSYEGPSPQLLPPANSNRYNVNSNHGTAADIKALSKALHARGMYLMVDVVANHMVGDSLSVVNMELF